MTESNSNEPSTFSNLVSRIRDGRRILALTAIILLLAYWIWEVSLVYCVFGVLAMAAVLLTDPSRDSDELSVVEESVDSHDYSESIGMELLEALPGACYLITQQGILKYANSNAVSQFGKISPGDPLSFSFRSPEFLDAVQRVGAILSAECISWLEISTEESLLEAYISPISLKEPIRGDQTDSQFLLLVYVQDFSEQRRIERMRVDFVANASHELRTPLASLAGYIETLQGPAKNDTQAQKKFLSIMSDQAKRMSRLIDDLLSLSRIELKPQIGPESEADLVHCIGHVCDSMSPMAAELSVGLEIEIEHEKATVNGEFDELVQVLENLIGNALRYGSDGKRIVLSLTKDDSTAVGPCWTLSVRDFGPGIEDIHLPRITERFYSVDVSTDKEGKGTGLGLAIVKHVVNRHNGRLSIESKPGMGALFSVQIPVVENHRKEAGHS